MTLVDIELCKNGTFEDESYWTIGDSWTVSVGVAQWDESIGENNLSQNIVVVPGHTYELTFKVGGLEDSASVTPWVGGVSGTARSSNGTYVEEFTAINSGDLVFVPSASGGGNGIVELDDISVKGDTLYAPREEALYWGMHCKGWGWCTILHGGWFWPRSYYKTYEVYRGIGSPLNIDWATPVWRGTETVVELSGPPHLPSGVYYYAVRTMSIYGISDFNMFRIVEVVITEDSELEGPRAAFPIGLVAVQALNGAFDLVFRYRSIGEYVAATSFRAYEGPIPEMIDYEVSIGTLTIRRGQLNLSIRTPEYSHDSVHYFVVRATTSDGVEEQNENYVMGMADALPPQKLSWLNVR